MKERPSHYPHTTATVWRTIDVYRYVFRPNSKAKPPLPSRPLLVLTGFSSILSSDLPRYLVPVAVEAVWPYLKPHGVDDECPVAWYGS